MKKLLSVFCMAVLAGGMIFTSCGNKQFTIKTVAEPAEGGTVTGGGVYDDQAVATLTAIPNPGYEFVQWQDNSKENPRNVTVTANETWTAHFKKADPGIKVTFKNTNWDASAYGGVYVTAYTAWEVVAAKVDGSYPKTDVAMYTSATGSVNSGINEEGELTSNKFGWIEYYENTATYTDDPEDLSGDWWAKTATVDITAFDATSFHITANVNATMFDVLGAWGEGGVGLDAAPTTNMTINMNDIDLTSAKGLYHKKHKGGKLVASK